MSNIHLNTRHLRQRKKGARNLATQDIRLFIAGIWSEEEFVEQWRKWLTCRDERIAFEAFKLSLAYRYGKPSLQIPTDNESEQMTINISAIPSYREPAD